MLSTIVLFLCASIYFYLNHFTVLFHMLFVLFLYLFLSWQCSYSHDYFHEKEQYNPHIVFMLIFVFIISCIYFWVVYFQYTLMLLIIVLLLSTFIYFFFTVILYFIFISSMTTTNTPGRYKSKPWTKPKCCLIHLALMSMYLVCSDAPKKREFVFLAYSDGTSRKISSRAKKWVKDKGCGTFFDQVMVF